MVERWKPSVTVAAVIEREHQGVREFLLVEEHTRDGLRLNNPAGHLEPGESPQQAVVRETLEETARRFTPTAIVGVYLARSRTESSALDDGTNDSDRGGGFDDITYLRLAFAGEISAADPALPLDAGIVGTVWLSFPKLLASRPRHRSPLVVRSIEDFIAGRRFPLDLIRCEEDVLSPPGRDPLLRLD